MSTYGPQQHYKIAKGPEEVKSLILLMQLPSNFKNNAVVEENTFTDLRKRKKLERQLTRSEKT